MQQKQVNNISFYQFENLMRYPVTQGVFTRQGGVSPSPWHSLNFGRLAGDDPVRVRENYAIAAEAIGRTALSYYEVAQVHGTTYVVATSHNQQNGYQEADVLVTDDPKITLLMRFADCVPILLYDPKKHAAALIHAGWRGTIKGAAAVGVTALKTTYGSHPNDLIAGIGPSICQSHYQVGDEVYRAVVNTFPNVVVNLIEDRSGAWYFDLVAANYHTLLEAGVRDIEISNQCTACNTQHWFSHRAEGGKTGRFGAVMALDENRRMM